VARLNDAGSGWEQVIGGASPINQSPTMEAAQANLAAIGGVPYVAWSELDATNSELRVARLEPEFLSRNASPTDTGATLSAQVRTFGLPYPIGFEYGSSLEAETAPTAAPTGQGNQVTVSQQVSGLTPSTAYAFRPFASAGVAAPRVLGSFGTFATTATPAPPADPTPPVDTPPPGDPPKPESDIAIGKAKLNVRKGTAKLPVEVPGAGSLDLAGRGLERARKEATRGGTVNLPVRPRRKLERKLDDEGEAKVRVDVTFTPTGGEPNSESATVNLKQR
jgi:hypothetical protein